MQPSLLTVRKHLRPLAWLLGLALLVSASPHLAQGLVLCIGENHVEVETSGAGHHTSGQRPATASAPASLAPSTATAGATAVEASASFQVSRALYERGAACIDVPLRAARSSDLCHQAMRSAQDRADVLLPGALLQVASLLSEEDAARETPPAYPHPSPIAEANPSLRTLSSVVLLI